MANTRKSAKRARQNLKRNARNQVRCYIRKTQPARLSTTYQLVRSLEMTQIAPGTQTIHKPSGETHTHPSDALGYLVAAEFPAQKPDLITHTSFANPEI